MRAGGSPRYILIGCIAAMCTTGCIELTSPDDPSIKQGGASVEPIPTFHEVQPILMERCTPCHVGEKLNDCPSTCFASFYEALVDRYTCCAAPFTVFEEPPENCANLFEYMTIGECGLERVINFENDGKDPVPPDQALILKTWVEHGMPE